MPIISVTTIPITRVSETNRTKTGIAPQWKDTAHRPVQLLTFCYWFRIRDANLVPESGLSDHTCWNDTVSFKWLLFQFHVSPNSQTTKLHNKTKYSEWKVISISGTVINRENSPNRLLTARSINICWSWLRKRKYSILWWEICESRKQVLVTKSNTRGILYW